MIDNLIARTQLEIRKNIPFIVAAIIYLAIRLTWGKGAAVGWSGGQQFAIALTGLMLTIFSSSQNDKLQIAITYLIVCFAPVMGAPLSLGAVLAINFMLERGRENIFIGSIMLLCFVEHSLLANGQLLVAQNFTNIFYLVSALILFIVSILSIKRPSILFCLLILAGTSSMSVNFSSGTGYWLLGLVGAALSARYGFVQVLAVLVMVFAAISFNVVYMFIGITTLLIFEFSKKHKLEGYLTELIPALLILILSEGERSLAFFFFILLVLKTISGSRIRSCLTKQHSS